MPIKEVFVEHIGEVTLSKNRQANRFKITVRPDGKIRVTIPWLATFRSGEEFLNQHHKWITETREKLAQRPKLLKLIQPGHLFSTRNYHYHLIPADVPNLHMKYVGKENQVIIQYPANQNIESDELQKRLILMIEHLLRFEAKRYLPVRLSQLAKSHGYLFQKVTIKNNKTNWGSCSYRKNINLNLHLMLLRDRLIDYILVHELVHTVIPNHGSQFKATMKMHFEDMGELDKELKRTGTGLLPTSKM